MSLKILGGMAKGFTLATASDSITRPTSVMLKRRLFDYYQDLSGIYFFDLCAGSGNIGIEASSRGASPVYLIESNLTAYKVLQKNILKFTTQFKNVDISSKKISFENFIKEFKPFYLSLDKEEQERIFLFFDPPYENTNLYDLFFDFLQKLDFKGVGIVEACRQKTMLESEFQNKYGIPTKNYKQGTSFLYVYDYNKNE